jgi:hypothetical protein
MRRVSANFWLAILLVGLGLGTWGCAVPYPILERPQTPPGTGAEELLGRGPLEALPFAGAQIGRMRQNQDGSQLGMVRFADSGQAMDALKLWKNKLAARRPTPTTGFTKVGSSGYLTYHTGGMEGLAWTSGVWLFIAEARDPGSLSRLLESSPLGGIASGQATRAIFSYIWLIIPVLSLVGLAGTYALMNLVARWWAVKPKEGAAPVSRPELLERLLALNDEARPFTIAPDEKADLVAQWNMVDATWWEAFQKAGLSKAYRLRLALDEGRYEVRAFEETGSIEWSVGPQVRFAGSWFQGIVLLQKERAVACGLKSLAPLEVGKIYDYSFDVEEIKGPVIDIVTGAGWRFASALFTWQVKRTA